MQGLEEDGGRTFLLTALPVGNVRHKDPEGEWKKLKKKNPKPISEEARRRNHEINDQYKRNGLAPICAFVSTLLKLSLFGFFLHGKPG